jgi:hypothetical protein
MAGISTQGGAAGEAGKGGGTSPGGSGTVWKSVGTVQEVTVEELVEPEKHHMFSWKPCEWTKDPACEELVLDGIAPFSKYGGFLAFVHDDGSQVRVTLIVSRTEIAAITDENGKIQRGFRIPSPTTSSWLDRLLINGNRFSLSFHNEKNPTPGIFLGDVLQEEIFSFVPKWPKDRFAGGMPHRALGTKRMALGHYAAGLVSVDAFSGNPVTIFSESDETQIYAVTGLQQANDWFVSVEAHLMEQKIKTMLVVSDGISAAVPLFPPEADADDSSPMFADTHIGWLRGFGYKELNSFEKVELWASTFSQADPHKIEPYKVADFFSTYVTFGAGFLGGGWGRIVHSRGWSFTTPDHVNIVDLTKKSPPIEFQLPEQLRMLRVNGVTRTHAWFTMGVEQPGRRLVRWKLPPGGSSPTAN